MLLENIHCPDDLKKLDEKDLPLLAYEIRKKIIETVRKNGGHMASNLGIVEVTLALHRVFKSPQDAIIFDVSHQSYTHKLLTGRYEKFDSLRKKDGLSGFTRINESPHDYFDAGHASSSISSALGLLTAWELEGKNDKVVAVIGDGALTGGMAFEALSHAGQLSKNLIVVLNDNKMSISKNTGSISRYLSRLTISKPYQDLRHKLSRLVDDIPYVINRKIGKFIYRLKRGLKGLLLTNNLFVDLGFEYVGPLDGHNIAQLERVFEKAKKVPRPVVIHVVTKKGKGLAEAEAHPENYHGLASESKRKSLKEGDVTFTKAFSKKIIDLAGKDKRICAITAAMAKGTGLEDFSHLYKDRFFDVGIAEEHAVTFAGGLAAGGMIPFCAIYSTFMQRSVDQVIEDLALQKRHVILCLDRAGPVSDDGETHQGIFDIVLFKSIPNLTILSPASQNDLCLCIDYAVKECVGPVLIRWAKAVCPKEIKAFSSRVESGKGIFIKSNLSGKNSEKVKSKNKKILLVSLPSLYSQVDKARNLLLEKGVCADIYLTRFIKPFDYSYFLKIAEDYDAVLFAEDGLKKASLSEEIELSLKKNGATSKIKTKILAFPDNFISNGTREEILEEEKLDGKGIYFSVMELLKLKV